MMKWLFFASIMFVSALAQAQVDQPFRSEFEMGEEDRVFDIVNAGDKGLFLFRQVRNRETKKERKWEVVRLDTSLQIVWRSFFYIDLKYLIRGFDFNGDFLYLLYEEPGITESDLIIQQIHYDIPEEKLFVVQKGFAIVLSEFEVMGNMAIFAGNVNSRPTIFGFKLDEKKTVVFPGFYEDKSVLTEVAVEDENSRFHVLTSFKPDNKRRTLNLKTFNEEGEMITNVVLKPSKDYSLLDANTVSLKNGTSLLVGTYTVKRSDISRGIFVSKINPDGTHIINYYNFADLKNFFGYLDVKREERLKSRIAKRKEKGRRNTFNYRILVHDIIESKDQFVLVAEAYYPKYTQNSFVNPTYYGSYDSYGRYFEGYRYTHAIVVGFDKRGRIIWDNSFKIEDVLSYNLEQFVNVSTGKKTSALMYLYDNIIRTKIIDGSEVKEGKALSDVRLLLEDEVVSNTDNTYSGIDAWYGPNFYAYGVQKLRHVKDKKSVAGREVYFVNKITYKED